MKILVVDDDAIVIKSCRRILESGGFDVIAVSGANEALSTLKDEEVDLLLMDVKMPRHDGLYLMREMKKNAFGIPVIVMSGYPTPETVTDVMSLGAARFIPKPFKPDELIETVQKVLEDVARWRSFPTGSC
jgi:DNA-binding NtrC family response regulator